MTVPLRGGGIAYRRICCPGIRPWPSCIAAENVSSGINQYKVHDTAPQAHSVESGGAAAAKHMTTSSVARCSMGLQCLVRSMSSDTAAFVSTYLGKRGALGSAVPRCGGPARGHLAAVRHLVGRAVYAAQISGSTTLILSKVTVMGIVLKFSKLQ